MKLFCWLNLFLMLTLLPNAYSQSTSCLNAFENSHTHFNIYSSGYNRISRLKVMFPLRTGRLPQETEIIKIKGFITEITIVDAQNLTGVYHGRNLGYFTSEYVSRSRFKWREQIEDFVKVHLKTIGYQTKQELKAALLDDSKLNSLLVDEFYRQNQVEETGSNIYVPTSFYGNRYNVGISLDLRGRLVEFAIDGLPAGQFKVEFKYLDRNANEKKAFYLVNI